MTQTTRQFRAGTNVPPSTQRARQAGSALLTDAERYLAAKAAGKLVAHHSGCRCARPTAAAAPGSTATPPAAAAPGSTATPPANRSAANEAIPPAPPMPNSRRTPPAAPGSNDRLPDQQRPMSSWWTPTSKK